MFVLCLGLKVAGCGRSLLLFAGTSDAAAGHDGVSPASPPEQGCNTGRDLGRLSSGSTAEQKMLTEFTKKKVLSSTRYSPER